MQNTMQGVDSKTLENLKTLLGEVDFIELLNSFIGRSNGYLKQIKQHALDRDFESLHFVVHTLKGSSANVGAAQLSDLCASLDQAVFEMHKDANDLQLILQLISELEAHMQQVKLYLEENYCSSLQLF